MKKTVNYYKETKQINRSESITGHFIFHMSVRTIERRFESSFNGILKNIKVRPKDIRIASVGSKTKDSGIAEAAKLANHKDTRITEAHYDRMGVVLDDESSDSSFDKAGS